MKIQHPFQAPFALTFLFCWLAQAAAPQVKTPAPGFYRLMVGSFEVTALIDGFYPLKTNETLRRPNAKSKGLLAESFQDELVPTSVNAFLVNTGDRLVLIDTGSGQFYGSGLGHISQNLKAAGYTPEQVDEVAVTHLHTDHAGGLLADGKAAYPNAVLRVAQNEADFWLNLENAKKLKGTQDSEFANAAAVLAPYKAAGKLKTFSGQTELVPGITAVPSVGHTPGHTTYTIESKGKKLLLIGDTLHVEALQFADPQISLVFDTEEQKATVARRATFESAANKGYLVGASHLPFPGIGHVVRDGKQAYRFLPVPYAPLE